jgi:type VI secretion system protein ImpA
MESLKSVIDIDALLKPISEERPTGIDVREDESPNSLYYQLKDARSSARAEERGSVGKPADEINVASEHWKKIQELAPRLLTEQTKDLEVAAWYTEALIRKFGIVGLRDGLELLNGLIETYWDNLHPFDEEDTIEFRIAPVAGLFGSNSAGTLPQQINRIAITDPNNEPFFEAWQYQQAVSLAKAPDAKTRNKRIESGVPTLDKIESAAKKTKNSFYLLLKADIDASINIFNTLTDNIDSKCNDFAPNGSFVRNALNSLLSAIEKIAKHAFEKSAELIVEPTDIHSPDVDIEGASATSATVLSVNNIKQRSEAFATIQVIADFFRKTEPHSPISYALDRIIKWGDMELPELLKELVEDKVAREAYCKLTGVEVPKPAPPAPAPGMAMQQHGYNDPMSPPPLSYPMDAGGYPSPPAPGGPYGDPMYNNTF